MQSMYSYRLETYYVSRVFCGKLHVMLFLVINVTHLYINTFPSMCAVLSMAVFCTPITSRVIGMLFRCLLNDFDVVPFAVLLGDSLRLLHSICAVLLL
jgi:hypothetical protein